MKHKSLSQMNEQKKINREIFPKEWQVFHKTRETLIKCIDNHVKSISNVNVYNSGSRTDIMLNTSGDFTLMNEHMGLPELEALKKKIIK